MRRDRPDWLYLQGWGAMNPTAVQEAAKIGFKMDHLVGVWWSGGDQDARPAGAGDKGYTTLDINAVGTDFPAIQDILKYVVYKGKSQTPKSQVGENLYDRAADERRAHRRRDSHRAEIDRQEADRRRRHAPGLGVAQHH